MDGKVNLIYQEYYNMRQDSENLEKVFADKDKPLQERKVAYDSFIDGMMNPKTTEDFDPETFDPLDDMPEAELVDRKRVTPPKELPTLGLKPKEIREGQMIGMYESKQDLYLLFANRCNDMQQQIDGLVTEIKILKTNKN